MAQPIDFNLTNENTRYMCHSCFEIKKLNWYIGNKNNDNEFTRVYGFCNKQCMLSSYFITHNLRNILQIEDIENKGRQVKEFFQTYLFFHKKGHSKEKSYVRHQNVRIYELIRNFKVRKDLDFYNEFQLISIAELELKFFMLINDEITFCSIEGCQNRTSNWNNHLHIQ